MATFTLGKDGKFYINDTLFTVLETEPTSGTWTEFDNVRDLEITTDTDEIDITTRANSGFRATAATIKDSTIEFEALWKVNDTNFNAIQSAWDSSGEIAAMALDGDRTVANNSGLIGNFTVPGFSRSEPIADAMKVSITLKGSSFNSWASMTLTP